RLQIQERLTDQIAHVIMEHVRPYGVGVVIEARHLCMMMRGVEKQSSVMTSSTVLGTLHSSHATRSGFLSLLATPASCSLRRYLSISKVQVTKRSFNAADTRS